METPSSRCPAWLVKFYGAALYLYPKSFREDYREQMLQVFIDNYRRQQKPNSSVFFLETVNDLGASMSQEHFSDFSKHGRIRMAILGLCFVLGILAFRPFFTTALSDGFDGLASIDDNISDRVFVNYADYSKNLAVDLLQSDDPLEVLAAAGQLSEWMQWYEMGNKNKIHIDLITPVMQTLKSSAGNADAWLTAYPLCVRDESLCDAKMVLNSLQRVAPENGITWLYHASDAHARGNADLQALYLEKANAKEFFDDGKNAMNASWHYAFAERPYSLPWYSFFASRKLTKLETTVTAFENYGVPGCKDASKSTLAIQQSCREIAMKIARQSSSSISLKLAASNIAAKLGDSDAKAQNELLQEQIKAYYFYVYGTENKDIKMLAEAYAQDRQYAFFAKMATTNQPVKYPDIYEF